MTLPERSEREILEHRVELEHKMHRYWYNAFRISLFFHGVWIGLIWAVISAKGS